MSTRVLFICTGNLCRSPTAEVLLRHAAANAGLAIETRSAGIHAPKGHPADQKAARVLAERGLSLAHHTATQVSSDDLEWADRVFCMEVRHLRYLERRLPEGPRCELLGPLAGFMELADPHGAWWLRPYRQSLQRIERAVERLLEQLQDD